MSPKLTRVLSRVAIASYRGRRRKFSLRIAALLIVFLIGGIYVLPINGHRSLGLHGCIKSGGLCGARGFFDCSPVSDWTEAPYRRKTIRPKTKSGRSASAVSQSDI